MVLTSVYPNKNIDYFIFRTGIYYVLELWEYIVAIIPHDLCDSIVASNGEDRRCLIVAKHESLSLK